MMVWYVVYGNVFLLCIFYCNKRINTVEIDIYMHMYRMDDLKPPGLLRVLFMYHNHMGGQEHCVKSYEV